MASPLFHSPPRVEKGACMRPLAASHAQREDDEDEVEAIDLQPSKGLRALDEEQQSSLLPSSSLRCSTCSSALASRAGASKGRAVFWGQVALVLVCIGQFIMLFRSYVFADARCAGWVDGAAATRKGAGSGRSGEVGQPFQTKPELFPGPTPTGPAPFLAQTNPAPFASTTYIPNSPLETQVPIQGSPDDGNIFQLHGQLSHYFPNPDGFGVDEYSLPDNARIAQLHMLHRHGARYPTIGDGATHLAAKIQNFTSGTRGEPTFTGELSFLNSWEYLLGNEILVPVGKQELFDSGTLHQYMYGHLYPNNGTKITARSTTQDRMTKSAEYFLAGFFGLGWEQNATLVLAIEDFGARWNNTLAGYYDCPNSNAAVNHVDNKATADWVASYLQNATSRLAPLAGDAFNWTLADSYNAQSLCAYETVALGYSSFCSLFTYPEWEGYEYSIDVNFAGTTAFQSPTGRAVGIGYVEEIRARLNHHLIKHPIGNVNVTLDSDPRTFPLDQNLFFDFSHDTNIVSILTAFGLTQFAALLPADHIKHDRDLIVSHISPFATRLDIEIIDTPSSLSGDRKSGDVFEADGDPTKYVHFLLNQRTIPLARSWPQCGERDDGWCEMGAFMELLGTKFAESAFDFACFGEYEAVPYGSITDGRPLGSGDGGV